MHHKDLKCGEIVDHFCYIPKTVYSMNEDLGVGVSANFGPLVRNFRKWADMKSNGYSVTRNKYYDP